MFRHTRKLLLSLMSSLTLTAQTTAPTLSLPEAEALALKNHPQILAADANSLSASEVVIENKAAYYPTLNGEITGAQANLDSRLGTGVLNDPRLFNHFGAGLNVSQLITGLGTHFQPSCQFAPEGTSCARGFASYPL